MATSSPIRVSPIPTAPFGVSITGVNPGAITPDDSEVIRNACIRGKGFACFEFERLLEASELHALTAEFGANEVGPGRINGFGKRARPGEPELSIEEQIAALQARGEDPFLLFLGNVDPKTLELRSLDETFYGEWEWHTDMSYIPVPPTFSLLHARLVPEEGGDTGFCNQVMAAAALPAALRKQVLNKTLKHDSTYGSSGALRPGMTVPASPVEALGHAHPILRVVPETGEEALFLGRRTNAYITGLPLDESEALVNELWAFATQPEFCYRHTWRVGQVVAWDNRRLLHMRHPVDNTRTRFMWRTQTKGEAVQAVPA